MVKKAEDEDEDESSIPLQLRCLPEEILVKFMVCHMTELSNCGLTESWQRKNQVSNREFENFLVEALLRCGKLKGNDLSDYFQIKEN